MSNGKDTGSAVEERSDNELPSPKPEFRKRIFVEIKLADNHCVASFNHGEPRIFHNMVLLLAAIEIESSKLGPGPTVT